MPEFENKVAIVTGGGGGIGAATAARLVEEGASVLLSGRRRDVLEAAQRRLGSAGRVAVAAGDVGTHDAAERLVAEAVERFGRVDVLVNSTGIFRPVPFLEQTPEHVEEALDSILR